MREYLKRNSLSIAKAVQTLGLPSNFRARVQVEGSTKIDGRSVPTKVAKLHSGTAGVVGATILIRDEVATIITEEQYNTLVSEITGVKPAVEISGLDMVQSRVGVLMDIVNSSSKELATRMNAEAEQFRDRYSKLNLDEGALTSRAQALSRQEKDKQYWVGSSYHLTRVLEIIERAKRGEA